MVQNLSLYESLSAMIPYNANTLTTTPSLSSPTHEERFDFKEIKIVGLHTLYYRLLLLLT